MYIYTFDRYTKSNCFIVGVLLKHIPPSYNDIFLTDFGRHHGRQSGRGVMQGCYADFYVWHGSYVEWRGGE